MYNYTFVVIILLLDKESIGIMKGHIFYNTKVVTIIGIIVKYITQNQNINFLRLISVITNQ